jgi:hypothetical protein
MSKPLYSGLSLAQILAQGVSVILNVDASGNTIDSFSGSGTTTTVNGISPTVTIAGAGSVNVATVAGTITISGTSAGTVTGPATSNVSGIAVYADTSGQKLVNTNIVISPQGAINFPGDADINSGAGSNVNLIGLSSVNIQGAYTNIKGTNYIDLLVGGSLINQITSAHSQFYNDIVPWASGTMSVGERALPFSGVIAQNIVTQSPNGNLWVISVSNVGVITASAY